MANISQQIVGEISELGKQIGSKVAKIPGDIAGKALESLGASAGGKRKSLKTTFVASDKLTTEKSAIEQYEETPDLRLKRLIARRALEQIAGLKPQKKEPAIWERMQMEAEQKKNLQKQQTQVASPFIPPPSKRPRGDLYGLKSKQRGAEQKNVRQD